MVYTKYVIVVRVGNNVVDLPVFWRSARVECLPQGLGGGPRVVVSTAAFHARVRGSVPGLGGLKETKMFLPHPRVKVSIVGSLRDREVACSASDRQGSNFESCVWRTVSSQSSHHPQEVLLAQFSLCVHKGGLKPDSFHFILPQGLQALSLTAHSLPSLTSGDCQMNHYVAAPVTQMNHTFIFAHLLSVSVCTPIIYNDIISTL